MRYRLAPSILSADFAKLGDEVRAVAPFSDVIHVDVMDGHFVPPITIGPVVVRSLKSVTDLPLECHLMVSEPEKQIEQFAEVQASSVVWHLEASHGDPRPILDRVRDHKLGAGLAINPGTSIEDVEPFMEHLDTLICMTVNPGWAGQAFIESVLPKIEAARSIAEKGGLSIDIAVDGGVNAATGKQCLDAGANVLGAATSIFGAPNIGDAAKGLRELLDKYQASHA